MRFRQLSIAAITSALVVGLAGAAPAHSSDEPAFATITGTVTFQGEPVAGADILHTDYEGDWFTITTTGADGVFLVDNFDVVDALGGEMVLRARAPGFLTTFAPSTVRFADAERFPVRPGTTTTIDIELVAAATVQGKVVDAKGRPVAGASVSATNAKRAGSGGAETDENGDYVVSGLASGPVDISVTVWSPKNRVVKEGSTRVKARQGKTVTADAVVLADTPALGKITGKVTRLKPGDILHLYNTKSKDSIVLGWTNKKKLKVNEKVEPGTYRLVVAGLNHASKKFKVKPGKTVELPRFKGPKGKRGKVSGTVRTASGKALKGAAVHVTDAYGTTVDDADISRKGGKFTITGLGKGRYTIGADKWPGKHAPVESRFTVKKRGASVTKSLRMGKTYTVKGRVTADGEPVKWLAIHDGASSGDPDEALAWTDAKGRFTIKYVPRGKQRFVTYDEYPGGYRNKTVKIKVKKNVSGLRIKVKD